jgi:hypothetical protein
MTDKLKAVYEGLSQKNPALVEYGYDNFSKDMQDTMKLKQVFNNLAKRNETLNEYGFENFKRDMFGDTLPKEQPEVSDFDKFHGRGNPSDTIRPTIKPDSVVFRDSNQPQQGEFNPMEFENSNPTSQLSAGWKAGVQNLKGGLKYLGGVIGETLDNLDGEDEMQWDNRLMESARKNFAAAPQGKGIWYELGSFAPQMIGIAAASVSAPITAGTSMAAIPALIGGSNIAMLVGSASGMAMNQYDEYKDSKGEEGSDLARIGVGVASGAAEYLAERIGLDRYMPKGSMSKAFSKFLSKNDDVAEKLAGEAIKKNPSIAKDFLKKTARNMAEEGTEESFTEAGNILIETVYKDKEDYETFEGVVERIGSAFRGGAMMGGVLSPITYTADRAYKQKMHFEADGSKFIAVDKDKEGNIIADELADNFVPTGRQRTFKPDAGVSVEPPTPPTPDGTSPVTPDSPQVPPINPRDTYIADQTKRFEDFRHESGNLVTINTTQGPFTVAVGAVENNKFAEPDGTIFVHGPDGNNIPIQVSDVIGDPVVKTQDEFLNDQISRFDAEEQRRKLATEAAFEIDGQKLVDTGQTDEQGNMIAVPLDDNGNPQEAGAIPLTPEQVEQAQQRKQALNQSTETGQPQPEVKKATWGKNEYQYTKNEDGTADVLIPNKVKPEAALKEIQKHFENNPKFEAVPVTETREVPAPDDFSDPTTEDVMTGIKIVPKQIATPVPSQDNKKTEKQAEPKYLFGKEALTPEEAAEMINLAETPQELEGLRIDNDPELQQILLAKFPEKAPKYTIAGQEANPTTIKAMIRLGKNLDQISIENDADLKTLYDKKVKELNKAVSTKGTTDNRGINPEVVSNLSKGLSFGTQSFSDLDIETKMGVQSLMLSMSNNPEVRKTVIGLIPIDVMNDIAGKNFSAEEFLNNESVFRDLLSIDANSPVFGRFIDNLRSVTAGFGAKVNTVNSGRASTKDNTTVVTGDINAGNQGLLKTLPGTEVTPVDSGVLLGESSSAEVASDQSSTSHNKNDLSYKETENLQSNDNSFTKDVNKSVDNQGLSETTPEAELQKKLIDTKNRYKERVSALRDEVNSTIETGNKWDGKKAFSTFAKEALNNPEISVQDKEAITKYIKIFSDVSSTHNKQVKAMQGVTLSEKKPRSLSEVQRKAVETDVSDPLNLVKQYFIQGGKINKSALEYIYGDKSGQRTGKTDPAVEAERKRRIGYYAGEGKGKGIDEIAHELWGMYGDMTPEATSTDYRDALIEVISGYNSTTKMAESINKMFGEVTPDEQIEDSEINEIAEAVVDNTPTDESVDKRLEKFVNDIGEGNNWFTQYDLLTILESNADKLPENDYLTFKNYLNELIERDSRPFVDPFGEPEPGIDVSGETETSPDQPSEGDIEETTPEGEAAEQPGQPEVTPELSLEQLVSQVETETQRKTAERNKQLEGLNPQQRKQATDNIAKVESSLESKKTALTEAINAVQQAKDHFEKERTKQGSLFTEQEPSKPFFYQGIAIDTPKDFSPENINRVVKPLVKLVETRQKDLIQAQEKLQPQIEEAIKTAKAQGSLFDTPVEQRIAEAKETQQIRKEENKVNTEPTEAQKEAGNYQKGHVKAQGFDITIEQPRGSTRTGTDSNGKQWSVTMNNTYGYFKRTKGKDGDQVDVFLGAAPETGKIFVVDQNVDGKFDEHKVMLGFNTVEQATDAYLDNYEEGWQGLGAINEVSREDLKAWLKDGTRTKKPFAESKEVPQEVKAPVKTTIEKMNDARAEKILDTKVNMNGSVKTRREHVQDILNDGGRIGTAEVNKVNDVSRRTYNRMTGREQEALEKRIKEGGKKTEYRLYTKDGSFYDITKAEYDYAKQIGEAKPEATSTPDASKQPTSGYNRIINAYANGQQTLEQVKQRTNQLLASLTMGRGFNQTAEEYFAQNPDVKAKVEQAESIKTFLATNPTPEQAKAYLGETKVATSEERLTPKVATSEGKQPWEMTVKEVLESIRTKPTLSGNNNSIIGLGKNILTSGMTISGIPANEIPGWEDALLKHKEIIKQAISEGKIDSHPDYPELSKAKQPHEMTREEFIKTHNVSEVIPYDNPKETVKSAKQRYINTFGNFPFDEEVLKSVFNDYKGIQGLTPEVYNRVYHERIIKQALSEGKTIPAEVLKDYPDLVVKKNLTTESAGSATPLENKLNEIVEGKKPKQSNIVTKQPNTDYIVLGRWIYDNNQLRDGVEYTTDKAGRLIENKEQNRHTVPGVEYTGNGTPQQAIDLIKEVKSLPEIAKTPKTQMYDIAFNDLKIPINEFKQKIEVGGEIKNFPEYVFGGIDEYRGAVRKYLEQIPELSKAISDNIIDRWFYEKTLERLKSFTDHPSRMGMFVNDKHADVTLKYYKDNQEQPAPKPKFLDEAAKAPATELNKILSASSRFKPAEAIFFDTPIIGPSGAKLTSYEWKYEWTEEWNERKGETVDRRISDWSNAEQSAETGRDIVHQFTVQLPDGTTQTVSSESALVLLGITDREQMKSFPSLVNAVKTLSKQQMQLSLLEAQKKQYDDLYEYYSKADKPEITADKEKQSFLNKKQIEKGETPSDNRFFMGDSFVDQSNKYNSGDAGNFYTEITVPSKETIENLTETWIKDQIKEAGIKNPEFKISELKSRIARQERKVNELTKQDEKPKPLFLDEAAEKAAKEKPVQKIDDFGEKIEGAKKMTYQHLNKVTENDILSNPLSKTFPRPDFVQLVKDGTLSEDGALVLKFMYDNIPAKPRKGYKLKAWTKTVQEGINTFTDFLDNKENGKKIADRLREPLMEHLNIKFQLFEEVQRAMGFPNEDVNMGAYEIKKYHRGEKTDTSSITYSIVKSPYIISDHKTVQEAADALKKLFAGNKEKAKDVKLSIYQDRKTGDYFIGKKTATGVFRLVEGFKTAKEASEKLKNEMPQLQELWDATNTPVEERRKTNRDRVGTDYRKGKDITPEQFSSTFGFRGTQFGNWVKDSERQESLNDAYDALMDLSTAIGVSPRALSLGGELGMAFGARGSGKFSAHYESGQVVINLTKTRGAGSLAHEWWHALDNYFSRQKGSKSGFITESPGQGFKIVDRQVVPDEKLRNELIDAFKGVINAIKKSKLGDRSFKLDGTRSKMYWSTMVEMSARSFENFVIERLGATNEQNDYLANFKEVGEWIKDSRGNIDAVKNYPYPLAEETPAINEAFQQLFDTIQEKEEGGRTTLFDKSGEYRTLAENNLVQDAAIQTQITWEEPVSAKRTEAFGSDTETREVQRESNYDPRIDNVLTFIERQLSDSGYLTFMGEKLTGTTKIKSANDVAFLFKNLESASSENVFAVHVDENGNYKVQYLSTGSTIASIVDAKQIVGAAQEFKSKKVWFVHNHPSGNLKPSDADYRISKLLKESLEQIDVELQPPVIINLDSGQYSTINIDYKYEQIEHKEPVKGRIHPVKVHQFDKLVFHRNTSERTKISGVEDVAMFLSKQKRGTTNKIHVMILDRSNSINRYYLMDETISLNDFAAQLASDVSKYGEQVILASNGVIGTPEANFLSDRLKRMESKLLDVLTIKQDEDVLNNYRSMANSGLILEPEMPYVSESSPRYRKVSETGFYSTVENALGSIKQERGTPEQLKAMLLKNGAKQAEMDWMGWDDRFPGSGKAISKAEVQQWINQNRIEVKEVNKSASVDERKKQIKAEFEKQGYELTQDMDASIEVYEKDGDLVEDISDLPGNLQQLANEYYNITEDNTGKYSYAKYSQYQLPGGSNYKEMLLTMPGVPFTNYQLKYDEKTREYYAIDTNTGKEVARNEYYTDLKEELKNLSPKNQFKSSHWDEPNILAHIRHKDYTDSEGRRILLIEELQSDWAQEGRKKGFKGDTKEYDNVWSELVKTRDEIDRYKKEIDPYNEQSIPSLKSQYPKMKELDDRHNELIDQEYDLRKKKDGVPSMPFPKTDQWVNLALRRAMRYAAENGYDGIAWTPGEVQAGRYDLSKQVNAIQYFSRGDEGYSIMGWKNEKLLFDQIVQSNKLEETLGKEVAQKIINNEGEAGVGGGKVLRGNDLKVGGTGMKSFYDQIIPAQAAKVAKPFNSKVQTTTLNLNEGEFSLDTTVDDSIPMDGMMDVQFIPVTSEMVTSAMQGVPLFKQVMGSELVQKKNTKKEIRDRLNEVQAQAKNARRLFVYETIEELESTLDASGMNKYHKERALDYAKKDEANGFYMTDSKAVFINIADINNVDEAVSMWIHEMGIHAGLRNVIPSDVFEKTMEAVYDFVEAEMQKEDANKDLKDNERIYRAIFEVSTTGIYEEFSKGEKGEEMIAYMAEELSKEGRLRKVDQPFWDRVVQIVLDMFKKLFDGNKILLSKQDITNIIKASIYSNYAQGETIRDKVDRGDLEKTEPEGILRADGKTVYSLNKSPFLDERLSSGDYMPDKLTINGVERHTRNSNGQLIHPTRRGIENFYKWFGDSKVVDAEGRPMVVYHGTSEMFDEFIPRGKKNSFFGKDDKGIYFTDNYNEALSHANGEIFTKGRVAGSQGNPQVVEAYIKADYTYDITDWRNPTTIGDNTKGKQGVTIHRPFGYSGKHYFVKNASQIKSATGNDGGFNPDDNRILFRKVPPKTPIETITESAGEVYRDKENAKRSWKDIRDGMIEFYKDSERPIRRLQERIKELGGKITDKSNPYRDITLAKGRLEALYREFNDTKMKPVIQTVTKIIKSGVNGDNILPYLIAKHSLERNPDLRAKEYDDEIKKFTFRNQNMDDAEFKKALEKFDEALKDKLKDKDYSGVMEFQRLHVARGGQEYKNPEELARAIVDGFESKVNEAMITELWDNMKIASTATLDIWKASNAMTEAEYNQQLSRYKNFVPLRGWREAAEKELAYVREAGTPSPSLKHAQGRKSMAENPLAVMENVAFKALGEQVDNEVNQAMLQLVVNNYNKPEFKSMYELKTAYYVKGILEDGTEGWVLSRDADGELVKPDQELFDNGEATIKPYHEHEKRRTKHQKEEHELLVKGAKMDHIIVFKNKSLNIAQAMKHQNVMYRSMLTGEIENIDNWNRPLSNTLGRFNNFLKAMYTSYNIVFPFTNFARDANEAALTQWIKGESGAAVIKNYKEAFPAILRDIRGKSNNSDIDKHLKRFYEVGGATGYTHLKTPEQIEKELNTQLKDMLNRGKLTGSIGRNARHLKNGVETWNRIFEDATRFSVYLSAIQAGHTEKDAASMAKEASVNFNRKGKSSKSFDSWWAFWNVALESMFKNFGLAKKAPARFATVAGGFVFSGFIMALLNDMMDDDEDKDKDYYNISEFARFNYLLIPDLYSKLIKGESGDKYLRIPLPQFWRGFYAAGSLFYDVVNGKVDPIKAAGKSLGYFAQGLSPVDITGLYVDGKLSYAPLVPTVFRPFQEIRENTDFLGSQIYKDPFTREQKEMLAQSGMHKNNVNVAAKFATDLIFRLGGGEQDTGLKGRIEDGEYKKVPGYMDINPSIVEHIFKGYTGGTGGVLSDIITTVAQVADPSQEVDFRNVPYVNAFVRKIPEGKWATIREFYDLKDKYSDYEKVMNEYRKIAYQGGDQKRYVESATNVHARQYIAIMNNYDSILNRLMKNIDMKDADNSKQVLDLMEKAINDIEKLNKRYNK